MAQKIKIGKWLDCGCCGGAFQVWEGYEDQDQDLGYGICAECQGDAEDRLGSMYDDMIKQVSEALSEKNKAQFDGYDRDLQVAFVNKALDDGLFKWSIGGR